MNFKQWYLNEVGTGTSSIAVFARPIFGGNLVSRIWPQIIAGQDLQAPCEIKKNKKKKKKKKED